MKDKHSKLIQLDSEYYEMLQELSKETGMSMSKIVHIILNEYIKEYNSEEDTNSF